jgi:hypothetical protein
MAVFSWLGFQCRRHQSGRSFTSAVGPQAHRRFIFRRREALSSIAAAEHPLHCLLSFPHSASSGKEADKQAEAQEEQQEEELQLPSCDPVCDVCLLPLLPPQLSSPPSPSSPSACFPAYACCGSVPPVDCASLLSAHRCSVCCLSFRSERALGQHRSQMDGRPDHIPLVQGDGRRRRQQKLRLQGVSSQQQEDRRQRRSQAKHRASALSVP